MKTNADHLRRNVILLLVFWRTLSAHAYEFAGGTGEPNNPYQIATAEQLISIGSDSNLLDKHFVLLNDIDLDPNLPGGQVFTQAAIAPDAIGLAAIAPTHSERERLSLNAFTGQFDGRGHIIRRLTIQTSGGDFLGLFGKIGYDAWVHNLRVEDVYIMAADGSRWVGALAGSIYVSSRITDCRASGRVEGGAGVKSFGGLIGIAWLGSVTQCYASCEVRCGDHSENLGGLVGENGSTLTNCQAGGSVSGGTESQRIGGLAGSNGAGLSYSSTSNSSALGQIVYCYAGSRICAGAASTQVGGLVGGASKKSRTGNSESTTRGGEPTTGSAESTTTGSFWDIQASGLSVSAWGTGLSTAQVHDPNVYAAVGWDLVGERTNGTADLWLVPGTQGHPVLTVLADGFQPHPLSGSGTPDDPYQIATAEDLGAICHYDPSCCYQLAADIDLSGITWRVAPVLSFDGRLDGAGFALSNFTIQGRAFLGLFGILGPHAEVVNLRIVDANVAGETGSEYVGGVAALNEGTVADCSITGAVSGAYPVGGLAGKNAKSGTIVGCTASVDVTRTRYVYSGPVGGLVGYNVGEIVDSSAHGTVTGTSGVGGLVGSNRGETSGCFATGQVTGYDDLGGLVGRNSRGTITDCYATGSVQATAHPASYSGGLTGGNEGGTVIRCYAAGAVFATHPEDSYLAGLVGGVPGDSIAGTVTDSFWDIEASGLSLSDGGTGLTTAQMRRKESFPGWDFENIWTICEGKDYPRLRWEQVQCGP